MDDFLAGRWSGPLESEQPAGPGLVRLVAFALRGACFLPLSLAARLDAVGRFAAEFASAARLCCRLQPESLAVLNGSKPHPRFGVDGLVTSSWVDGSISRDSFGRFMVTHDLSNSSDLREFHTEGLYTDDRKATDGVFFFPETLGAREQVHWLRLEVVSCRRRLVDVRTHAGRGQRTPVHLRGLADEAPPASLLSNLMLGLRLFMELTLSCVLDARRTWEDGSLLSRGELFARSERVAVFRRVRAAARNRALRAACMREDAAATERARAAAADAAVVVTLGPRERELSDVRWRAAGFSRALRAECARKDAIAIERARAAAAGAPGTAGPALDPHRRDAAAADAPETAGPALDPHEWGLFDERW